MEVSALSLRGGVQATKSPSHARAGSGGPTAVSERTAEAAHGGRPRHPTCPPFMSFMFMAFFTPLPFSFLFFFFLQQHFLQMQKQQVSSSSPATTAMAISAQGGTAPRGRPSERRSASRPRPQHRQERAHDGLRRPRPVFNPTLVTGLQVRCFTRLSSLTPGSALSCPWRHLPEEWQQRGAGRSLSDGWEGPEDRPIHAQSPEGWPWAAPRGPQSSLDGGLLPGRVSGVSLQLLPGTQRAGGHLFSIFQSKVVSKCDRKT